MLPLRTSLGLTFVFLPVHFWAKTRSVLYNRGDMQKVHQAGFKSLSSSGPEMNSHKRLVNFYNFLQGAFFLIARSKS
jgi:hypothetical protein